MDNAAVEKDEGRTEAEDGVGVDVDLCDAEDIDRASATGVGGFSAVAGV
jgi:hypothetical protein